MRLEASVPSESLPELRIGAPVSFAVRGYEQQFEGRIERIAPQADAATRQVPIYVAIPERRRPARRRSVRRGAGASRESATGVVVPVNAVNVSRRHAVGAARRERQGRAGRRDARPARSAHRARAGGVGAQRRRHAAARRGAGHCPGHAGAGQRPVRSGLPSSASTSMFISDIAIKRPVLTIVSMLALVGLRHRRAAAARHRRVPGDRRADRRRSRSRIPAPRPTWSSARSSSRSRK